MTQEETTIPGITRAVRVIRSFSEQKGASRFAFEYKKGNEIVTLVGDMAAGIAIYAREIGADVRVRAVFQHHRAGRRETLRLTQIDRVENISYGAFDRWARHEGHRRFLDDAYGPL